AVDNTFERLKEDLDDVLRSLLEEPHPHQTTTSPRQSRHSYTGCMNTDAIEELGAQPLLDLLRELGGGWPVLQGDDWNDTGYDWVRQMAHLRNYNNDILVSEWVAADITNSSNHIIQLDQPELGLPGREYFINPGDYFVSWQEVVVFGLDYFKKLVSLLKDTNNRTISNYLMWRFVKNRISNLGESYTGRKSKTILRSSLVARVSAERWRSCVTYVSGNLGYVVGAMFVKRYFPEASKNDTHEMIGLIRESFRTALHEARWMHEDTRKSGPGKGGHDSQECGLS
ncbi:hypothetical protein Pcinc_042732, partial [Petrolisthes cinctipes]